MLIVDLSNRNFILVSGENLNEYGVKGYIDAMRGYNNNFAREVYSFDKALKIEGEYEEGIREFFENNPDRRQDIVGYSDVFSIFGIEVSKEEWENFFSFLGNYILETLKE